MGNGGFLAQLEVARSYGVKLFKAESMDDLTEPQYRLLFGCYIEEKRRAIEQMRAAPSPAHGRRQAGTVRIHSS